MGLVWGGLCTAVVASLSCLKIVARHCPAWEELQLDLDRFSTMHVPHTQAAKQLMGVPGKKVDWPSRGWERSDFYFCVRAAVLVECKPT
jgi:hypothetical protein